MSTRQSTSTGAIKTQIQSRKKIIKGPNGDTTDGRYNLLFLLEYCRSWLKNFLDVDALWEYFSQAGKVDACTIMRDAAGRSRCFAF